MQTSRFLLRFRAAAVVALACVALPARADLPDSFAGFPDRIPVGDPDLAALDLKDLMEGPKGVAAADFDGDLKPDLAVSNLDSSITVLLNAGGGRFAPPRHLRTEARELRSIIAADLNNDGKPDLAVASPQDGQIVFFLNAGGGSFGPRQTLAGWLGVRCLAAGDFDGDGVADLAAAGPGAGVRHFRGTGGGNFSILGDVTRLSPGYQNLSRTRPVYSVRTIRSRDGLRDDLLVTHADSASLWILSTQQPDRWNEPPVLDREPQWNPGITSPVVLNEVQVQNATTLRDADGTTQPWVELLNSSSHTAVNLAGWKLKLANAEWTFPSVTVEPGRFLVVFLSGKNRNSGPELHASFLLKQSTAALNLLQPGGTVPAASVDLPKHLTTDVSRGLAPDSGAVKWFDIPSPGAENNAGFGSLDDMEAQNPATLTITPRQPAAGQSTTIRVTLPEKPTGSTTTRVVWFAAISGLREVYFPMLRRTAGVYEVVLEPGVFAGTMPHRVLARFRDDETTNDYTVEVHRGLDDEAAVVRFPILPGCLLPVASVPAPKAKSFEIGVITVAAATPGARPDLVFADDTGSVLRVHRATNDARRFSPVPLQELRVEGLPRDVKLGDMDQDGWVDVLVVLQVPGAAVICRNNAGTLRAQDVSRDTGSSPREAVLADFTGDDRLDAAVINRYSEDVSILAFSTAAGGLVTSDQIYPVDADVAALSVRDFDGNGRDDVLQLHRASSEISLRLSAANGRLAAPRYFPVGAAGASALEVLDVNHDGLSDVVTANLGIAHDGSISVLLGTAGGNFQAPRVFNAGASLFALSVADFDKDGHADVAAGLWDCSMTFLHGDGTGTFAVTPELPVPFVNEARVMVTGDFDQDGDLDIAGAGIEGDMVTLENRTTTAQSWRKQPYAAPGVNVYGAYRISLANLNNDNDPDLIIGTGRGVMRFLGMPGMLFSALPLDNAATGVSYAVSDVLAADLDLDGTLDLVTACRAAACLDILSQLPDGRFQRQLQVAVPSSLFLATGNLDDDGKPDLIGTGDVLWTALSSRAPQQVPASSVAEPGRPQATGLFINEILPRNTDVSVVADGGRKPDYVEIFNGTAAAANLTGWKMRVQGVQEGVPFDQTWTLPTASAAAGGRTMLIFSEDPGQNHAGFSLPAEGGTVTLLRPDNSEADRVVYPPAPENVAWSRYQDGHPSFRADPVPSPGLSNVDNGGVPPEVKLTPPSPRSFRAGEPIKFTARGSDDHGIISLSLFWNRLDAPYPEPQRLNLYDDGRHGDGPPVDGVFAGTMPALPAGAEVQFYMEATDIGGEVLSLPEVAELSPPGEPPVAWSFTIADAPTLEITEVCTDNSNLLRDETGGHPDYIKVRNTGTAPVPMSNILLARSPLSEGAAVYAFPAGLTLSPGADITVFADGNPAEGPLHAPFSLDADGDDLSLLAVQTSGARLWIHSLTVPALAEDVSFGRIPGTELWVSSEAMVGLNGEYSGITWDDEGQAFTVLRFRASPGATWIVEGDAAGAPVAWATEETIPGDDAMHTIIRPLSAMTALRVSLASLPAPLITATIPGVTEAGLYCYSPGTIAAALFYSVNADLSGSRSITLTPGGTTFSFNPQFLLAGTTYYYRVWTSNGISDAWTQGIGNFRTLTAGTVVPVSLLASAVSATRATVTVTLNSTTPPDSTITVLAGTSDSYANPAAWPIRLSFTGAAASWVVNPPGLLPDTLYYVRAAVTTAAGTASVSPRLLTFRTLGTKALLTTNLVISEIMYNPPAPTAAEAAAGFERDDFEFIELQNLSTTESLDLSGLWFEGIDFDFPASGAPVLPPGGLAIIAAHPLAFAMRYGPGIPLAGWTLHPFRNGKLTNGGELLVIHMASGDVVRTALYDDDYADTDGAGNSLVRNLNFWQSGNFPGGTPGWLSGQQTFTQWTSARFTAAQAANASVSAANADPDGDGLTNFAEFAAGTDPLRTDSSGLLTITDGGLVAGRRTMRFSFPVNLAGCSEFRLQYNTPPSPAGWLNLGTYYTTVTPPVYSGLAGSVLSSATMSDPRRAMVTISVPLDVLGTLQPRRFFRLTMAVQ